MSGGHFNYSYGRVRDFAEDLEHYLSQRGKPTGYGDELYGTHSEEVTAMLKTIAVDAYRFSQLMRAVEWLASGDYSDESFLAEMRAIEGGKNEKT